MKRQFTGAERFAAFQVQACALLLCPLLATASITTASADGIRQWERDVALTTASGDQGLMRPIVISDGGDGAFVVWHDRIRAKITIQRLASDGSKLWPAAKQVATNPTEKMFPAGIASGQGGVIIAWAESRTGGGCGVGGQLDCDIYAQKFDSNGQRVWSNVGRPVVRAPGNQGVASIALASDEQGGMYAAWIDARPSCCKIYAQHLGADGRPLWAENGIRISPEPFIVFGSIDEPLAVSDGAGGVLVAWLESQVNPVSERSPIKVQRLDADGDALWSDGGISVGEPIYAYFSMAPDSDGGALIGYTMDGVNGFGDTAVQKVTQDGTLPWGAAGVRAAVAGYYHIAAEVVSDDQGGAIVAWIDNTTRFNQDDADIRAQRVLSNAQLAWPSPGRVISDLPGDQDNPRVVRDGNGGAFVFWRDCRDYLDRDPCFFSANMYGQHIRRNGTLAWAGQGAPVSRATGSQGVPQGTPIQDSSIAAASDEGGGAFLAWPDGRIGDCVYAVFTTECDVRAQRVADDLTPAVANLEVNLEGTRSSATGELTFKVRVRNLGPDTAEGIKLFVPDLANLFVQGMPANGTLVGNSMYVSIGSLAIGRARTATFSGTQETPSNICMNGKVYSETLDTSSANDRGQACIAAP